MPNKAGILFIVDIGIKNHLPIRDDTEPHSVKNISRPIVYAYFEAGPWVQQALSDGFKNAEVCPVLIQPLISNQLNLRGVSTKGRAGAYDYTGSLWV